MQDKSIPNHVVPSCFATILTGLTSLLLTRRSIVVVRVVASTPQFDTSSEKKIVFSRRLTLLLHVTRAQRLQTSPNVLKWYEDLALQNVSEFYPSSSVWIMLPRLRTETDVGPNFSAKLTILGIVHRRILLRTPLTQFPRYGFQVAEASVESLM